MKILKLILAAVAGLALSYLAISFIVLDFSWLYSRDGLSVLGRYIVLGCGFLAAMRYKIFHWDGKP